MNRNKRRLKRIISSVPPTSDQDFDFVIVGGGSAGCALAARLAQDPTSKVLLIEAGNPALKDPRINVPALFGAIQRTNLDWQYETTTAKETRERVHFWPRGKALCGCSSINAMLYVRGNKEDFNEWESKHGCKGWSFNKILPYFLKSEGCLVDPADVDASHAPGTRALEEDIVRSREYVEEHVRRDSYTVYHPVGTCRMGLKGPDTVVGHTDLKVHGFANLRVADASIMPEITSGNTNAPCIMIGEVCADMIHGMF
ncbi:hypothetical protein BC830DRAFT_1167581 [Chytriomyces sp. MP71]|nr:hypothetical protein BC830DRAFT_1167581 [Chytriomyces sp. MP71]